MDYKKIGLISGIEIHQQLEGTKLFCDCPTTIREDKPDIEHEKQFNYFTLGYQHNDRLLVFLSHWYIFEEIYPIINAKLFVPNVGFSYHFTDEIVFKAHYAPVNNKTKVLSGNTFNITSETSKFDFYAIALSVIF